MSTAGASATPKPEEAPVMSQPEEPLCEFDFGGVVC